MNRGLLKLEQFEDRVTPAVNPFFAIGNAGGSVSIVDATNGTTLSVIRPLDNAGVPYTGLVEVALGDFNGDSVPDLVASAADAVGGHGLAASKAGKVFLYDGGSLISGIVPVSPFRSFTPFTNTDGPFGTSGAYTNGLNVAVGDVNGNGSPDLIAGTRGGNGQAGGGLPEYGRLVVISGSNNTIIGGIQRPFGTTYQKGVVVAAGNADGQGGDEVAVTRGGPVASQNPAVQQIKLKVLQLQGNLVELPLAADGSTAFAPFGSLSGPANAINRDGRLTFVDFNGDGRSEVEFSALDPLTNPNNPQVRLAMYQINFGVASGAAQVVSLGLDGGTYLAGTAVVDHAIANVTGVVAGTSQSIALLTQSAASGVMYLAPQTGTKQTGGFALNIVSGGVSIDGV